MHIAHYDPRADPSYTTQRVTHLTTRYDSFYDPLVTYTKGISLITLLLWVIHHSQGGGRGGFVSYTKYTKLSWVLNRGTSCLFHDYFLNMDSSWFSRRSLCSLLQRCYIISVIYSLLSHLFETSMNTICIFLLICCRILNFQHSVKLFGYKNTNICRLAGNMQNLSPVRLG